MTFDELYNELVIQAVNAKEGEQLGQNIKADHDKNQLDCLLHPEKHPIIWKTGECDCSPEQQEKCARGCLFEAMHPNQNGGIEINDQECVGCGSCVDECGEKKRIASRDIIAVLQTIHSKKNKVYALIAPAFLGQFSSEVTPGKLRSALKRIGFEGMLEVSLFADILTLKEALEFDRNIKTETDYQLTSCCCPMWIAMIRKIYHQLMPHVPASVSPMIACGRTVKHLYPDAVTVFIGPCMAKKAEAREKDIADAVDFVLTFQEMQDVFRVMEIDPKQMEESDRDHSSRAGRIYARTGGVSEAVQCTLERLNPERPIQIRTQQADGVPACKAMINQLLDGKTNANFFEGMGCVGGCVGGPKAIISSQEGRENVNIYGDTATYPTPIENPYVIELLQRLGLDTVEKLLEHSDIFTRNFES